MGKLQKNPFQSIKVLTQYSSSNIEKTIKTLQRIASNPFKISTNYLLKAGPEYYHATGSCSSAIDKCIVLEEDTQPTACLKKITKSVLTFVMDHTTALVEAKSGKPSISLFTEYNHIKSPPN
jgi:hypothetical protein